MSSIGRITARRSDHGKFEEERQVYSSKQATVEVTVKVKKRRHYDSEHKEIMMADKSLNYPKGSWGDLLSQNRVSEAKEAVKDGKSKGKFTEFKCSGSEDGDRPKSICHKIPINDDLYLETHTHVRSKSNSPHGSKKPVEATTFDNRNQKKPNYEAENGFLRAEIERLRKEVEKVKQKNRKKSSAKESDNHAAYIKKRPAEINSAAAGTSSKMADRYRDNRENQQPPRSNSSRKNDAKTRISIPAQRESKQTSTTNFEPLPEVERRSEITQTDGRSTMKERIEANQNQMEMMLEMENKALRKEANDLLAEMQKAQREQQESIMTIKELYQLAELLKRENQQLLGEKEQQQFLQEKLVEAISENQDLKTYLDTLVKKQKECTQTHVHGDQLTKMRNVIEEVKSTIQDEIHGLSGSQSSIYAKPESIRAFNMNISEGESALLNDTNASEIQRILGSINEEALKTMTEESMSRVRDFLLTPPPPSQAANQRISTSTPSGMNSGRSSSSEHMSQKQRDNSHSSSGKSNNKHDGLDLESLGQDISRSFKPIQMELLNGSSSSEYRSTTSTPTNING